MSLLSFKKENHIIKKDDFEKVKTKGTRQITDTFIIYQYVEDNKENKKLGIAVTRKVGNAILRNRFKRIIREFFRLNKDKFAPGSLIFFIVKSKKANSTSNLHQTRKVFYKDIEKELLGVNWK